MKTLSRVTLAAVGLLMLAQASAQVTLYEGTAFEGRSFSTERPVRDLGRFGFNDRASSAIVAGNRWDRWEVCDASNFRGRCVVLRHGEYPSLVALGLNERISSVRALERNVEVADDRYAPMPQVTQANQITFYADEDFRGRSQTADAPVADFRAMGFNDRTSSIVVQRGRWELCDGPRFTGRCVVLRRGEYRSLADVGLDNQISSARDFGRGSRDGDRRDPPARPPGPPPVVNLPTSQVDLYEYEGFQGRSFSAIESVDDFRGKGFNDRASSAVVTGGRWEVCDDTRFGGRCVVLRPGQYPSLSAMGLNDRISSARELGQGQRADDNARAPLPLVARDYRRRNQERLYEASVTSVRAVVEDAGRQCWIEPEQVVVQERGSNNAPAAVLGAVIGGILGHQVGGGTGRDVATGIGVITGAAIGANAGRGDASQQVVTTQNVQRCQRLPGSLRPTYWDVTYNFRGQDYRVQMNRPPGTTVTVNEQGEPRA